jgi:hypothetical protein
MSLGHGGHGLDRWQPSLGKNEDQSPHAWVLMLNGVGGEVHGADIIAIDKCAPRRRGLKLVEQLTQPSGLSAGAGDNGLPLG